MSINLWFFKTNIFSLGFLIRIFVSFHILFFSIGCSSLVLKTGLMWERSKSDLSKKEIQIDQFHWVYLDGGKSEEVLLAIHGFGGDKDHWTRFARNLTDDYRVISPDLPGFGENSRIPNESYSIVSQVKRLHDFAQTLGLKKYHILGNSMGGSIAGVYAATYPNEIITLTLFDNAGLESPEPSELFKIIKAGKPNPLLVGSVEDFERLIAFSFVNPPYIPGPLKSYFTERAIQNRDWNEAVFKDIRKEGYPLEPLLGKIVSPTLIIWGKEDNLIHNSCTLVMDKKLKVQRKIIILPDVGHSPMIEIPNESAEIWTRWKSELVISK